MMTHTKKKILEVQKKLQIGFKLLIFIIKTYHCNKASVIITKKGGYVMKRISIISCILLAVSLLLIGCSRNTDKDDINKEEKSIHLKIIKSSHEEIMATEDNSDVKYNITNSKMTITDNKDNPLSWNELKAAKEVKVYYSGKIKEVSPSLFEKINKIVIIS